MNRRRILIFSLTYTPFIGGAEIAVKEITDRISEQDIVFDMVTLRIDAHLPKTEKVGNLTVYRLGFTRAGATLNDTFRLPLSLNKYLFPFLASRRAAALHRAHPYDAVWSIQANYAGFAALFFKRRFPNVPFILNLQEGDPFPHYKRRVGPLYGLYKKIFTAADHVHAIATHLADFARGMSARSVEVIPNGVDIALFQRNIPIHDILELRKHIGLAVNEEAIITTSRLVKKNGIDDCIRALPHLPQNIKLLIVGEGPDEKNLRKLARGLQVENRAVFVGHIPHEFLPYYLAASRVFVRPSLSEGMGNSFIEAMAAGIPVVATPVGGIPDFLIDPSSKLGKITPTGLFCAVRDPRNIAEKVKMLLPDTDMREMLINNARQLAREKYGWDRIVASMQRGVFSRISARL